MQFSSRSLLSLAAALALSTSNAFVPKNNAANFGVPKSYSSSGLNMVADDAKVILVTGSSRGLGKSIATDIGAEGHKIIINYVSDGSKDSAEEAVAEIKAAGGDAVAIQADCKWTIADYGLKLPRMDFLGTIPTIHLKEHSHSFYPSCEDVQEYIIKGLFSPFLLRLN